MPRRPATFAEEISPSPSSLLQAMDAAPSLDRSDYHRKYKNLYYTRVVPKPPAEPTAADAIDEICCCGCGLAGVQHDSYFGCFRRLHEAFWRRRPVSRSKRASARRMSARCGRTAS